MEFLENYNAYVRLINLPIRVKAFTIYDGENEFYNIYINNKISKFEQEKAVKHELEHIEKGHFNMFCDQTVNDIEWGMTS